MSPQPPGKRIEDDDTLSADEKQAQIDPIDQKPEAPANPLPAGEETLTTP